MDTKIYDILVSVNRNYTHSISQYDNYSNYYNTLIMFVLVVFILIGVIKSATILCLNIQYIYRYPVRHHIFPPILCRDQLKTTC